MANSSEPSAQKPAPATNSNSPLDLSSSNSGEMKTLFSGGTSSLSSSSDSPQTASPASSTSATSSASPASSASTLNLNSILPNTSSPANSDTTNILASAGLTQPANSSLSSSLSATGSQSQPGSTELNSKTNAFKQAFVPATSVPEISPAISSSDVTFNQEDASLQTRKTTGNTANSSTDQNSSPASDVRSGASGQASVASKSPFTSFDLAALKKMAPKQWALVGGGLVIFIALIAVIISLFGNGSSESVATPEPVAEKTIIEYWGLWESNEIMDKVLTDFENETGISVKYVKKDIDGYRLELQNVLSGASSGTAPDLFRYHFSWVPMLSEDLDVAPETYFSIQSFTDTYYPIATKNAVNNAGVIGVPLMHDGLALVYNQDLFEAGGVSAAPADWTSFGIIARQLTEKNDAGQITQAGAAIGLANNIDHFSDLFGVLALQNGVDLKTVTAVNDESALISTLEFYSSFYTDPDTRVWDENMSDSIIAFAEGRVAMIFVPSFRILDILALNPDLNIGVAPLPTVDNTEIGSQTWATFWVEGVSAKSKNKTAAWKLLAYLSRPDVQRAFFSEAQAMGRYFGEMYPQPNMASELSKNTYLQPYLYDAPLAQNFYLNDNTFDEGLNDTMIDYYAEVINDLAGQTNKGVDPISPAEAATRLRTATQEVLKTYLVPKDESK